MAKQSLKNYLRLDKIPRTEHSESVVHEAEALLAGHWVTLGTVIDATDRELVSAELATTADTMDALVAPVYLDRGYADFDLQYESTPAGEPVRAFIVQKGDIISFNIEQAENIKVGDEVGIGDGGFGLKVATGAEVIGKCIQIDYQPNVGELVVIRIA